MNNAGASAAAIGRFPIFHRYCPARDTSKSDSKKRSFLRRNETAQAMGDISSFCSGRMRHAYALNYCRRRERCNPNYWPEALIKNKRQHRSDSKNQTGFGSEFFPSVSLSPGVAAPVTGLAATAAKNISFIDHSAHPACGGQARTDECSQTTVKPHSSPATGTKPSGPMRRHARSLVVRNETGVSSAAMACLTEYAY